MKTLGQVVNEINFEAGFQGSLNVIGFIEQTFKDILDAYTGRIRYPELKQTTGAALGATPNYITLPSDLQSLSLAEIRYWPLNDSTKAYSLKQSNFSEVELNELVDNPPVWFQIVPFRNPDSLTLAIYPYSNLDATDWIWIEYWRTGSSLLSTNRPESIILPDQLVETVKLETIARCQMILGGKGAADYMTLKREAYASSLALAELPNANL